MHYTLTQGPTEKAVLEQCYRNRMPVPETIKNAPELMLGLELFYQTFLNLSTCRSFGGSGVESPISWLTISEYCFVTGITGDQREDVFYHIPKMDTVYMEYRLSQAKRRNEEIKQRGRSR